MMIQSLSSFFAKSNNSAIGLPAPCCTVTTNTEKPPAWCYTASQEHSWRLPAPASSNRRSHSTIDVARPPCMAMTMTKTMLVKNND